MSFLSNLFNGPQNAANAQIAAIQKGLSQASNYTGQANSALKNNYTSALQPYLTNYGTAQQGVGQLGNVLGLNGPAGSQSALAALESTPGYQFQKQQGENGINAAAAANGTLNSGNQDIALSKFNQGLAGTTYGNYVSQLEPYLSASATAANGIGNTYTGLGNALSSNLTGLGQDYMQGSAAQGAAQGNADLASQNGIMSLLGGVAKLGTNTLGGGALSGLGTGLMSIFSDERLKEDIKPIGELYDGQQVYSYKYSFDPNTPRIGLLAQEVEKKYPDAVNEFGGFKAVQHEKATSYAAELGKMFKEAA